MKGLEKMLKMFGIDPDMIKQEVARAAAQFNAEHKHFDDKLNRMEKHLIDLGAAMGVNLAPANIIDNKTLPPH